MKTIIYTSLFAFLLAFSACEQPAEEKADTAPAIVPDPDHGSIELPANFGAFVVADSLGRGRHLTVRDNGDIYVHLRAETEDGHSIIALRDSTGDGRADIREGFGGVTGTGIEIHNGYLYYASNTQIIRTPLTAGNLLPSGASDTLVTMVDGTGHMAKTFDFDGQGNMYVNIGSQTNACMETARTMGSPGLDPCLELETRAGIWKFKDDQTGQQQDIALRYATGIRNAVALSWNSMAGKLYALQHGRDDLHRFWPDLFTEAQNVELPAEEFLDIEEGDDFGWPYCYYDPFKNEKFLNPEYGGDGEVTARCVDAKKPLIGFPGHWAPNDLIFYTGNMFPEKYKNGAFIAWHGSWNRLGTEQGGYNVAFVPMKDGKPAGVWEIFASGFKGEKPITNSGDAEYRPCGLAEGPDGSLYVVDSQKGRVWRIMYYPEGLPEMEKPVQVAVEEDTTQTDAATESMSPGQMAYRQNCMACHAEHGTGMPGMNPPLIGTEWVLGDKERIISIVLNGFTDPIEINGETFQNVMGAMNYLKDEDIAEILTYVRSAWGNDASAVTAAEVTAVRNAIEQEK
ncbi:MAG: PQQ-dependent sugar dehydrogenase [Cyclobacteriaceae bacterium]|nr:PQQ-dependent sugar dehydrogenase [Cyclobacteriaceae bacterium]